MTDATADATSIGLAIIGDPCGGCGACCRHMVRPPFYVIGDPEWARLIDGRPDLVAEIEADRLAWPSVDDVRPCLWLDGDGRCSHYDWRPDICKEFEPAGEDCGRARARHGLPVVTG